MKQNKLFQGGPLDSNVVSDEWPDLPFLRLSEWLGTDSMHVQAAGGNTSIKLGRTMWIKASGRWLSDAGKQDVFTPVDHGSMRKDFELGLYNDVSSYSGAKNNRPSIEASMHGMLAHRIVIHTHPIGIMPYLIQSDGKEKLSSLVSGLSCAWVDYARPGWPLTRRLLDSATVTANVFFLANHGLVVGANSCAEVLSIFEEIERCVPHASRDLPPIESEKLKAFVTSGWRLPRSLEIHALGTDPITLSLLRQGVLYPDQVVFLGRHIPRLSPGQTADEVWNTAQCSDNGPVAPLVVIPGVGVVVKDSISLAAEEMLLAHTRILQRITPDSRISSLASTDIDELVSWDAEKYRQQLDAERRIAGA